MYKYTILVPLWYASDDGVPSYPLPTVLHETMCLITENIGGVTCDSPQSYGYWIANKGEEDEMRIKDTSAVVTVVCTSTMWTTKVMPIMCWLKKFTNQQSLFITAHMVEVIDV